jgi:peroxiredoxin
MTTTAPAPSSTQGASVRLPICLLVSLLAGCVTTGPGITGAGASQASDFTLTAVDGLRVTLSDHLGKDVVLLNFWATWCAPCAAEMPHLQRLYERHRDEGLLILAISMDGPESLDNVAPFVRRHGLSFPVLLDEETRVVGLYNPRRAAPFNVLIDRAGRVVKTTEGYNAGDEKAIEQAVLALLGDAIEAGPAEASAAAGE